MMFGAISRPKLFEFSIRFHPADLYQEILMKERRSFATIIIGQSSLLREGSTKILRSAKFRVVGSISSAEELPDKVQPAPTLILLVHTGDDFGFVIEQIELCKASCPNGQVAIVADRYRPDQLIAAFRAGASGCFVGVMTSDLFIKSLELVMMGEAVVPPALLSYFRAPEEGRSCDRNDSENDDADVAEDDGEVMLVAEGDGRAQQLSRRERGIVRFLIEGESNKSIARKLEIAEATVKVHVKTILRKIRVRNRTQAAIWGMNNEWQLEMIDSIAPPLSPAMAKRPPNDIGASTDIGQHDDPTLGRDKQGESG